VAKSAGAGGSYAVGKTWVVQTFAAEVTKKAAEAAGGDVL
jgi:hypothetical protein